MRLAFLTPFWGLFPISSQNTLQECRHIVTSFSIPREEWRTGQFQIMDLASPVLLDRLQHSGTLSHAIPNHHILSRSHYERYEHSPYVNYFTYADFCLLEEKMGDVVWSYLGDETQRWLLRLPNIFLYTDSIKMYLDQETHKKTCWITPSQEMGNPDYIMIKIEETMPLL